MQDVYVYLADIDEFWSVNLPEALRRLPEGYEYTWLGSDGAWASPTEEFFAASDACWFRAARAKARREKEERAEDAVRDWRRRHGAGSLS